MRALLLTPSPARASSLLLVPELLRSPNSPSLRTRCYPNFLLPGTNGIGSNLVNEFAGVILSLVSREAKIFLAYFLVDVVVFVIYAPGLSVVGVILGELVVLVV